MPHELLIQSNGCAVEVCGASTGHAVKPVAFCDSDERAAALAEAYREYLKNQINA